MDRGSRTEPPTPRRIRDARRKGQVAKSASLTTAGAVILGLGALMALGGALGAYLLDLMRAMLSGAPRGRLDLAQIPSALAPLWGGSLLFLLAGAAGAVLLGFTQTRGLLSLHPLRPDISHLSPLAGLGRLWGRQGIMTALRSLVALGLMAYLLGEAWAALLGPLGRGAGPGGALAVIIDGAMGLGLRGLALMLLLAGVDYLLAYRRHRQDLMMTKGEVKEEHRREEGDPALRGQRRQLHREINLHAMLENVSRATCVVVNPTRVATALSYDEALEEAPRVVAKGERLVARRIGEVARGAGVPVVMNAPLAWALLDVELGEEIPACLYEAVAEVLRFVYGLGELDRPSPPI